MSGSVMLCALLASGAAPVPPVPANQAPPPRAVKPDLSLIAIEWIPGGDHPNRTRLHRLGFRNGKMLPAETVWEGEEEFLRTDFGWQQIVADRLLVTSRGGVIDLREKKVLSGERDGQVERIDDKKVTYRIESSRRPEGVFTFEYATGVVTCVAKAPAPKPWHDRLPSSHRLSPDHKKAIRWENGDELILYHEGEKPKSLGKGFKMEEDPKWALIRSVDFMLFPVMWLDNSTFLTQRDHGKLVTVDLDGKVTEVATIKDAPKQTTPWLTRDHSGAIFYYLEGAYYHIDLTKKTATKSEWYSLGNGFEATWKKDEKLGYKFRHNGKEIGQVHCPWPSMARTVPGYLALVTDDKEQRMFFAPRQVAVWSATTGKWTTQKYEYLSPLSIVGWIK